MPLNELTMHSFKLIAAPFTPMDESGEIRYEQIQPYVAHLLRDGVDGVFIAGTTGEGMSLSLAERCRLAEYWRSVCQGLSLIVHVGHVCLKDAMSLAGHAQSLGVDGIAAIGPCFYEVENAEKLSRYCTQIASAARETPFYYYHMPSMARVGRVKASEVLPLLARDIPHFSGIKFTHEDIADYQHCLAMAEGKWEVFFGRDELLLSGLQAGATSAVGSTYNFSAPLYRALIEAFRTGDLALAQDRQRMATWGIETIVSAGGLPALKAMMRWAGVDCGPMRLPLAAVPPGTLRVLFKTLSEKGYLPLR